MKYQAENAVSSFFYYMWNAWSKEECKVVFGDMYRHFWDKWSALADKSIFGAAERFFAELSENNQKLLVERAVTLYDGRAFRKEPDDSDILVCKECGSRQLEIQAWINANTDERISYVHDDNNGLWCDGKWCEECGVQVFFCTKAEFTQKMQGWWESCGLLAVHVVPAAKTKKATQPTARLRGKKVASAQKSPRVFRLGQSTTTGEILSRKTEEKSEPLPAVPVAVVPRTGRCCWGLSRSVTVGASFGRWMLQIEIVEDG